MKTFIGICLFLTFLLQLQVVHAFNFTDWEESCFEECDPKWTVGAKSAAFFPLSSKVQRIYGNALPEFTLEGNLKIWEYCGDIYLWLDGSYIWGNGHSYGYGHHHTHLSLAPITLGLKFVYHLSQCSEVYLGVGPAYSFLHIRDSSPYVHRKTSANHAGAIVKSGFVYNFFGRYYLETFLNYTYQKFNIHGPKKHPRVQRHDVDLSSLQLGAGIGIKF